MCRSGWVAVASTFPCHRPPIRVGDGSRPNSNRAGQLQIAFLVTFGFSSKVLRSRLLKIASSRVMKLASSSRPMLSLIVRRVKGGKDGMADFRGR